MAAELQHTQALLGSTEQVLDRSVCQGPFYTSHHTMHMTDARLTRGSGCAAQVAVSRHENLMLHTQPVALIATGHGLIHACTTQPCVLCFESGPDLCHQRITLCMYHRLVRAQAEQAQLLVCVTCRVADGYAAKQRAVHDKLNLLRSWYVWREWAHKERRLQYLGFRLQQWYVKRWLLGRAWNR